MSKLLAIVLAKTWDIHKKWSIKNKINSFCCKKQQQEKQLITSDARTKQNKNKNKTKTEAKAKQLITSDANQFSNAKSFPTLTSSAKDCQRLRYNLLHFVNNQFINI